MTQIAQFFATPALAATSTTKTSTTATSRSATLTSTSKIHLQQVKNSSQQHLYFHLRPQHFRCDCGKEEKEPEGNDHDDMLEKATNAHDFSSRKHSLHSCYD
jgi:hypothetical protein